MADPISDDQLETLLYGLGDDIVVPSWTISTTRAGRARSQRTVMVAAAIVLIIVAAAVSAAPVRHAVARVAEWLTFGSTRIEHVDREQADPTGLLAIEAGARRVSAATAQRALGRPLPATDDLLIGVPDLIAIAPEGGVLLVWERDATSLWLLPTADPAHVRINKLLDEFDSVEPVDNLGEGAVYIAGDHVMTTPSRRLAAGSVLLWIDGGFEHRLESNAARATVEALARAITP